jgi:nucleoside-diphosphate-sugar epimerase
MTIKKAFVTGIKGNLGSLTSAKLISTGVETLGLNLREKDASKIATELKAFKPDAIFHTASVMDSKVLSIQVIENLKLTLNLAEAIGQLENSVRPILVNYSSASELGVIDETELPVTENYLCKPVSSYGLSKHMQSETIQTLAIINDFAFINARIFNILWSPNSKKQFLNLWLEQLAKQQESDSYTLVTGDLSISRDFINAETAINAIVELANLGVPSGTYNIAGGKEIILSEVIDRLSQALGKKIKIEINPQFNVKHQPQRIVADISKSNKHLKNKIGFELSDEILLALKSVKL